MATTYAIPDGRVAMAATIWSGDNTTPKTITNGNFAADFVWVKQRNGGGVNLLWDSVRAGGLNLQSQSTGAETAYTSLAAGGISGSATNGFTVAQGSVDSNYVNGSGGTYVGWQWKAGGTAVSNTAGSITSSVSANTTAGFSIVQFTATGATATVGHGLGVAPQMIIVKDAASAGNWAVWHTSLASTAYYLFMNTTAAQANTSAIWTGTPSSTTFGIGSWHTADRQIAYCFAPVAGYSAFGSYTGNNTSDGPFVYLGFRPRFIMVKSSSTGGSATYGWAMFDTSRENYNINRSMLVANVSDAENTTIDADLDILSNGFKVRYSPNYTNGPNTYIYMAFAENPFKYANAR